jgi:chromosome segregation ATPase
MSDHPIFAGARATLAAAGQALDQLEARYSAARAATDKANAEQGERAAELAAHKAHLAELTMRQLAEQETRRREIANRENAVGERERIVEEKDQRLIARERTLESRLADLSARIHGHAAA